MPHHGWRLPTCTCAALRSASLAIVLFATACSGGSEERTSATKGVVLYTIGLCTDPYGGSVPGGFGVIVNPGGDEQTRVEVRSRDLGFFGGAEWIDERRILVPLDAPPFRSPLTFRLEGGRLVREGSSPLPALEPRQAWSPDGKLIASEPVVPCEANQQPRWKCYRDSGEVYVQRADGSDRRQIAEGHFNNWTPDGRLLVTDESWSAPYEALEVRSGARDKLLSGKRVAAEFDLEKVGLGPPRWSADGRYLALYLGARWPKRPQVSGAIVIAQSDGDPIRLISSPYIVSMFAWSPVGHRLAWTTSGFPDPHELFVLENPASKPRRLFATGARHFDWITWSPDGHALLLDDENGGLWRLLRADGPGGDRTFPRAGGRPLWCCPVNAYTTLNG